MRSIAKIKATHSVRDSMPNLNPKGSERFEGSERILSKSIKSKHVLKDNFIWLSFQGKFWLRSESESERIRIRIRSRKEQNPNPNWSDKQDPNPKKIVTISNTAHTNTIEIIIWFFLYSVSETDIRCFLAYILMMFRGARMIRSTVVCSVPVPSTPPSLISSMYLCESFSPSWKGVFHVSLLCGSSLTSTTKKCRKINDLIKFMVQDTFNGSIPILIKKEQEVVQCS